MSLLLDALKKAAEQKAQKSKSEEKEKHSSDETLLDVAGAGDDSRPAGDGAPRPGRADETQLDHSDISARVERGERIAGDDTRLETPDSTVTRHAPETAEPVRTEDTGLDMPEATVTRHEAEPPPRKNSDGTWIDVPRSDEAGEQPQPPAPAADDETGLDMPDSTVTRHEAEPPTHKSSDETRLDVPRSDEVDEQPRPPAPAAGDETGLDFEDSSETAVDPSAQMQTGEDETIIFGSQDVPDFSSDRELDARRPAPRDDETDLSQLHGVDDAQSGAEPGSVHAPTHGEETDISEPVTRADEVAQSRPEEEEPDIETGDAADDEPGREDPTDADLSLLLVEPEGGTGPGGQAADTSFTDPQGAADRQRALADSGPDAGDLKLLDDTQTRSPGEQTDTQSSTLQSSTAAALDAEDTRTSPDGLPLPKQSTITRGDPTSTRTYAPDNYDRTLMKLPSDDASKLFAGMKSDGDVVMTPDHAKKVFRSKTSAQRAQGYKYYAGIAVVLLLAIAIFGAIEYQDESYAIDNSLRPLKRDPMPGLIKPQQPQQTDLFAGSSGQVDARTIEIIESAGDAPAPDPIAATEPQGEAGATAAGVEEPAAQTDDVAMASESPEATAEAVEPPPQAQPDNDDGVVASASTPSNAARAQDSGTNLQIRTASQYRQVDIWLREAYSAYRVGDNDLAMRRYNQVLDVDPNNRNALLARAAINVQNGNMDSAITDYQALLLANPKDSVAMSSLLGIASFSPRETESQLKLLLREEPDSPYLNFALANAYGAQDRWHEAQHFYFKALQNNPEDPNYAYNLAVSLEHLSQPGSAITYYRRALDNFDKGLATFSREIVDQRLQVLGKL